MDIATAEFFRKEREQCTTRDAKHVMPIKLIPDLEWKFIENISVMKSDNGVTIYCIKETEDEHKNTQVTEVSEPNTDVKITENTKPIVTGTVRATQTSGGTNTTETEEPRYEQRESPEIAAKDTVPRANSEISGDTLPRYEHRENSEIAAKDAVPRENSEISEDTLPRYEPRENPEITTEDAVPREITEETRLTGSTGISQAILVDPTKDTEMDLSNQIIAEQVEVTHIIDITELVTGNTEMNAEQAIKKTHKYPETNNSIVNKIFSVLRQAKESLDTIPM